MVVPQEARVDAVLLSDELVALPSSLSDAESAACPAEVAVVAVGGATVAADETIGVTVAEAV